MKFRIISTPESDKENEGKTLTLQEVCVFMGEKDEASIEARSWLADSFIWNGYMFEIEKDS